MKTIEQQLSIIKNEKRIGLMTHVVIGYPTLKETATIVEMMAENGADFIELQIPFSDSLADGPTIMHANDVAISGGVKIEDCFQLMKKLAFKVDIPLLFMGYYQSVFHFGVERFCKRAKEVGAQGLIIPDIPIDEEGFEHFIEICEKYDLHHIRLLSPSSTEERIKMNAQVQNGFVYCTSRNGVTGSGKKIDSQLAHFLDRVKKYIKVPVAVGFGISRSEQIQALRQHAEIAVVGSAVIDLIDEEGINLVPKFIKDLCQKK